MSASQLRCQKQRCYDSRAGIPFKDKAKSCQGTRIQKGESELLWVHLKRAEVQKQLVRVLLGGPCQQVFCKQDAQQTTMVQNTRLEEIGQNLAVTRCTCCKQNTLWKLPGASKPPWKLPGASKQLIAAASKQLQMMAASWCPAKGWGNNAAGCPLMHPQSKQSPTCQAYLDCGLKLSAELSEGETLSLYNIRHAVPVFSFTGFPTLSAVAKCTEVLSEAWVTEK